MMSLSFLAPVILVLAAAVLWRKPGRRPEGLSQLSELAALAALVLASAGLVQFAVSGPLAISALSGAGALTLQAGVVSVTLVLLVTFIGWVVMRYSRTYLDGEAQEGRFHALMLATLAAALVFVMSGSFWV